MQSGHVHKVMLSSTFTDLVKHRGELASATIGVTISGLADVPTLAHQALMAIIR